MSQPPREPRADSDPTDVPTSVARGERLLLGTTVSLTAVAAGWLVFLLSRWEPARGGWVLQIVLTAGFAAGAGWDVLRRRRLWSFPARQLLDLIPRVREGDMPIEALSDIDGAVRPLVPVIQDLLRELKRQKGRNAQLEKEIGQRVANRTDALERRLGSLRQQAVRDVLTGLYNRRMLDEHLPQAVERRLADAGDLSLLMIDVDYFKQLNDTLGHAAGDALLKSIGQLIRSSIRDTDLAFRCGGDEFVILCDGCDGDAARKLADRLITLVDALSKPLKLPRQPRLSIGISVMANLADPTPKAMLEEADRVLYEVKGARKRTA